MPGMRLSVSTAWNGVPASAARSSTDSASMPDAAVSTS